MMNIFVYILLDPRSGKCRYVGISNNPEKRYSSHILYEQKSPHKYRWVQSLLKIGLKPNLKILEICDENTWSARERWWIRYFKKKEQPLTNLTGGGEGLFGRKFSDEEKHRISQSVKKSWKNYDPKKKEQRLKKMSQAAKKNLKKNRHPMLGRKHTEETRRKLVESHKGHVHSTETKAKMSLAHQGPKNYLWEDIPLDRILEEAKINNFGRNAIARSLGVSNKTITNKIQLYGYKNWKDFVDRVNG